MRDTDNKTASVCREHTTAPLCCSAPFHTVACFDIHTYSNKPVLTSC